MKTTLNQIRAEHPCTEGWVKLLAHLGKTKADDEPLSIITVLDSNGLDDALWCLRAVKGCDREIRLYAVWCARQVQHLLTDPRSLAALDVAERYANGDATKDELDTARDAGAAAAAAADADAAWAAAADAGAAQAEHLRVVCLGVGGMTRICGGARGDKRCPRMNECEGDCHFNAARFKRTPDNLLSFSDRLLCWAIWGMVAVVLCLMLVPVVWLIGELV